MRGFLIKCAYALGIVLLLHLAAGFMADGTTDAFYLRFTVKMRKSLVLGGSRAAQGIFPEVFNAVGLRDRFEGPLYNFSFTLAHSPYGPTYLHAIEQVLDTSARKGLFLLQVDPWQLSEAKDSLPERERSLGVMRTFGMKPNYEYLARYWDRGWGALSHRGSKDADTNTVLLADGRLEAHVPMAAAKWEQRTQRRLRYYRDVLMPGRRMSALRMEWLGRTIDRLKAHGTVVLVRLPASAPIRALEDSLSPHFNAYLLRMGSEHGALFIDLSDELDDAVYNDGVHLNASSGRRLSGSLARMVLGASL